MDGGLQNGVERHRRHKCNLYFFLWRDSQDTVGRIGFFGSANKKPQFYMSGVIVLQKQAGLNSEENKQTKSSQSRLTNRQCVLLC